MGFDRGVVGLHRGGGPRFHFSEGDRPSFRSRQYVLHLGSVASDAACRNLRLRIDAFVPARHETTTKIAVV